MAQMQISQDEIESFLGTYNEVSETEYAIPDEGVYRGYLKTPKEASKFLTSYKFSDGNVSYSLQYQVVLEDPVSDEDPMEEGCTLTLSIPVITKVENGVRRIDLRKSVKLGKLREVCGQNVPGDWSPYHLADEYIQVVVAHKMILDKSLGTERRIAEIKNYGAPS